MSYPSHVKVLLINIFSDNQIKLKTYKVRDNYNSYVITEINGIKFKTCKPEQKDAWEQVDEIWADEDIQKKICEFRGY